MTSDFPEAPIQSAGSPPAENVISPIPIVPTSARESSLWSWTDLVVFVAFTALAFLVSYFVVVMGYVVIQSMEAAHPASQGIPESTILGLVLELVFYGILFACIYFLVVIYHHRPFWSSLGWRKPTVRQTLGYLVGGLVMAVGVQLAPILLPDNQDFPMLKMFSQPSVAYAIAAFAVLVAPFMEEVIFRGVLFAILERRTSLPFAIVTTAVLFGALHITEYSGAWNHLLLIFIVGGIFSFTRGMTRSLAPSVILHFSYNLTLMAGFYFSTHRFHNFGTL